MSKDEEISLKQCIIIPFFVMKLILKEIYELIRWRSWKRAWVDLWIGFISLIVWSKIKDE